MKMERWTVMKHDLSTPVRNLHMNTSEGDWAYQILTEDPIL